MKLREKLDALVYSGLEPGMRSSHLKRLTWKRKLLRGAAAAAVAAAVAGGFYWLAVAGRPDFARAWVQFTGAEGVGKVPPGALKVVDLAMNRSATATTISGAVANDSETDYRRVEINLSLTDDSGSITRYVSVAVPDVKARSKTPFVTNVEGAGVEYYIVQEIVGY
jgi:hypothetical protein